MQESEQEVIVLKPTKQFLSFLLDQPSDIEWLDLQSFQKDTTAYTFPRHETDEGLLDEIEKHFPEMFQHEVERWLGKDASRNVSSSFFDFLCFFKFELHTQLLNF